MAFVAFGTIFKQYKISFIRSNNKDENDAASEAKHRVRSTVPFIVERALGKAARPSDFIGGL